jgi:hypothetical protein
MFGSSTAASSPRMEITISSSIRVKPTFPGVRAVPTVEPKSLRVFIG